VSPLASLLNKLRQSRRRRVGFATLRKTLMDAVADGKLDPAEVEEVERLKREFGLLPEDVARLRADVYTAAVQHAKADRQLSAEEETELARIQHYLGVQDSEVGQSTLDLNRLRLLREVQAGSLPTISVPGFVLQKNELLHWAEAGALLEERAVRRRYEGGSRGVSFRIMKGVTYRVGAHRGNLVTETDVIPVSQGALVVTNKRVAFRGHKKGFVTRLDKVMDIQLFSDGVQVTDEKGTPRLVKFEVPANSEIVGMILTAVANRNAAAE